MKGKAALRWVRAVTLAAVMLGIGYAGHAAAGGNAVASSVLIPVFVLLTVAIAPLLDSPASTGRVSAMLCGGQAMAHALLEVLGGAPGGAPAMDVAGHSSAHHAGGHAAMLLAHLAAALVAGVWLAAGERAAWTLVALAALPVVDAWVTLRRLSGSPVVTPDDTRPRTRPCWSHVSPVRSPAWSGRGASRRGPPRVVAA